MTVSAIGIACKNIEKSIQFYNLLNLDFKEYGKGHYEATQENGLRIMLDSFDLLKEINKDWKEPINSGITLCFQQTSPNEVDKLFHRIVDAGFEIEKSPWDAFWGQRYASVRDPNGNQIDLFAQI
ncbi:VOC family protein [Halobacteriovorax sp. ZH4_bin.1]|uniref:VOC family protein n=1 Tax=unclassified Halobacteriovorax TaxID=2639665 RepID=UPI0037207E71